MKKNFGIILTVCFVVLIGIFATKVSYAPVDTLIRPPKIVGENSDVQLAFESAVGGDYVLKSPLSGEHRTSFIRMDIDNDRSDEVIVFYSLPDSIDVVRMNILNKTNDLWQSVSGLESAYSDVQQISFSDVDGDKNTEIIVCWKSFDAEISNTLVVYKIVTENDLTQIKTIFSKNYNEFLVCDVNNDSKTDILIFEKTTANVSNEIKGTFYNFADDTSEIVDEFNLDPTISAIGSVLFDHEADTGDLRIFVDGYKTDSGITTDMIIWSNSENCFIRKNDSDGRPVSIVAARSKNIYCTDINSDSYIDIPVEDYLDSLPFTETADVETGKQSIIRWMQHDGFELITKEYEIINSNFSYSIRFLPEYYGKFTIENITETGTMNFYHLKNDDQKKPKKKDDPNKPFNDKEEKKTAEQIFTIATTTEQDYGMYELSGYRLLQTDNGYNYYCYITEYGQELGINKEMIKSILYT